VHFEVEDRWAPQPVWTCLGMRKSPPSGIRNSGFPAPSESLYRVQYLGPKAQNDRTVTEQPVQKKAQGKGSSSFTMLSWKCAWELGQPRKIFKAKICNFIVEIRNVEPRIVSSSGHPLHKKFAVVVVVVVVVVVAAAAA